VHLVGFIIRIVWNLVYCLEDTFGTINVYLTYALFLLDSLILTSQMHFKAK